MAYESVNGAWPADTDDGRNLKPTPQEALAGARSLYRIAFKRPFRGTMRLTSGNRYTYIRRNVFNVNPDQGGGGWHEIVHGISHYACARLHPTANGHGPQHAFIERELINAVVKRGWLDGKLKRPVKPKDALDHREARRARMLAGIKRWEAKRNRADRALKKLHRRLKRCRKLNLSEQKKDQQDHQY